MAKQRGQNKRDVNAVQRVALALELRAQRLTFEEIARRAGYGSAASAYKAIQRELQRIVVEKVDLLRREELDSLDKLETLCWERLQDEDYGKSKLFAVDRVLAIKELRMKLCGLAVPVDNAIASATVVIREVPQGLL